MTSKVEALQEKIDNLKVRIEEQEEKLLAKIDRLQEALHLAETYMGNVSDEYISRRNQLIRGE